MFQALKAGEIDYARKISPEQFKQLQGDAEITAVTDYLKEHGEPEYDISVTERRQNLVGGGSGGGFESDAEETDVREAAEAVIKAKRASATLLQSRLRMGFAKASRILDILEERGVIGPQNSSKPREVLLTQSEFNEQFGYGTTEEVVEIPERTFDDVPAEEDEPETEDEEETDEDQSSDNEERVS